MNKITGIILLSSLCLLAPGVRADDRPEPSHNWTTEIGGHGYGIASWRGPETYIFWADKDFMIPVSFYPIIAISQLDYGNRRPWVWNSQTGRVTHLHQLGRQGLYDPYIVLSVRSHRVVNPHRSRYRHHARFLSPIRPTNKKSLRHWNARRP